MAVPVALVVLLSFPALLVAAGLALLAGAGLRTLRPQWHPLQRVPWLFVLALREIGLVLADADG